MKKKVTWGWIYKNEWATASLLKQPWLPGNAWTSSVRLTFIMVMAMYRASFTIMGSYVASSFGVGNPPKVRSGPVDEGEEPPGSRWSFFTFSGCTDFFCETGTALTSTWRRDTGDAWARLVNYREKLATLKCDNYGKYSKEIQVILTFMLGTCTTSPYWSLVCTTTVAGHPQRMSSLFKMRAVFWGSAYESGCSHLDRKPHACVLKIRSSGLKYTIICLSRKTNLTDPRKVASSSARWLLSQTFTSPGVLHLSSARTWWSPRGKSAHWFGGAGANFPPELPGWWGSETGPGPFPESQSETCTPESRQKERGLKPRQRHNKTKKCVLSLRRKLTCREASSRISRSSSSSLPCVLKDKKD